MSSSSGLTCAVLEAVFDPTTADSRAEGVGRLSEAPDAPAAGA